MPVRSESQRRAMYAALHGKSTLGIPRSVAAKFVGEKAHDEPEAKDMSRFDWDKIKDGFRALFKFLGEEEREPEHAEDDVKHDPKTGRFTSGSGSYVKKVQENGRVDVHHEETGERIGSVSRPDKTNEKHVAFHEGTKQPVGRPRSTAGGSQASQTMSHLMGRKPTINPRSFPSERHAIKGLIEHHERKGDAALAEDASNVAASVIFIEPTGHVLFAKRGPNEENWPDTWSLPGGRADGDEDPATCAAREATEELGRDCAADDLTELESKDTPGGFRHTTFACPVDARFRPRLNHEHSAFVWAPWDQPPQPLHPGVAATLDSLGDQLDEDGNFVSDESDEDAAFKKLEEELEAEDASLQTDKTGMIRTGAGLGELLPYTTEVLAEAGMLKGAAAHPKDTENVISGAKLGRPRMASAEKHSGAADIGGYPVKTQAQDGSWRYSRPLLETAARKARLRGRADIARRAEAILADDQMTYGEEQFIEPPPKPPSQPAPAGADEEERKIGADSALILAMDWCAAVGISRIPTTIVMAFDRDSLRRYDVDGHLHVAESNISKACVSPYKGSEIPDYKKLGLDPNKIYKLLRDPDELRKAAATSNGKPILWSHKPTEAEDHATDLVIGSIGDNASYEHPWLKNSLHFWPAYASKAIESGKQSNLSCGYRYDAEMMPGTFDGERYDGIMKNLKFNHLALVAEGRVPGAVVGDSNL